MKANMLLSDIVERNTNAIGGTKAVEAIHSVRMTIEITEPRFTASAVYVADDQGRMRIDVSAGGNESSQRRLMGKQLGQ